MAGLLDVMLDIETTGTDPVHTAMIQIAAVRFDAETKEIDTSTMFNRCLWFPAGRFWDEDTRAWWGRQNESILEDIFDRMEDPRVVIHELLNWIQTFNAAAPVRLWAKPTSFEFPFLTSYYKQFGLPMPFHYRHAVDVNSYIRGRGHMDIDGFWKAIPFQGQAHNALHDVLHQIHGVFEA